MWAREYIGLPYTELDCAALLNRVNAEQFGRELNLPTRKTDSPFGLSKQIDENLTRLRRISRAPTDGDTVLMKARNRLWHVGIFVQVGVEPSVLHALSIVGGACVHKIRELRVFGIEVEGYYEWRV